MILLCGIPSEPPVTLAVEAAEELGVEHRVVNQRHAGGLDVTLEVSGGEVDGWLDLPDGRVALETVTGVYLRFMDWRGLPEQRLAAADRAARAGAFHDAFVQWLDRTPARVANPVAAMASNASKPYQAQLLSACGLLVPATLVTSDPEAVRDFAAEHQSVIYKSVSAVRSIVQPLDAAGLSRLDRVRALPTQFQQRIDGNDIRVHVVGEEVLATEIRSEAVDYRYAARDGLGAEMWPVDLPDAVAQACLRAARELRLPFCGLDLRRTPDGEYYCFEANPAPAYSYYESESGQPIAATLIRWLAAHPEAQEGILES